MASYTAPGTIRIVFFTGTGGTEMAASRLSAAFEKRGATVIVQPLDIHKPVAANDRANLLSVMFPVYAGNAPGPVYAYIKSRPCMDGLPAAVISISGGGEAFINKASRLHTVRLLKNKGCRVVYEKMLVMPANAIAPTPDDLAWRLIRVLPDKAEKIAGDIMHGITHRTKLGPISRFLAALLEIE
jgi:flavodoxin